ncbi:MAG TPA: hypothetical protein VN081_06715 [Dongiaceae bacterium]|nr:hypothetical protein [Dongiaceae bacterium]
MSDAIYDRYKTRATQHQEEREAKFRRKAEADEQERLRLLETVPTELDRMFARLEETNYADEVVKGMLRPVRLASGEVREFVTWIVGHTNYWHFTYEDQVCNGIFVCSDRTFCQDVGAYPRESQPHEPVQLGELGLGEIQSVVQGINLVGRRMSEIRR